eukprot:10658236-Alexandrium_andersonii.AAC.1
MSASLVGSEMCIRDRVQGTFLVAQLLMGMRQREGGKRRAAGAPRDGGDSVSYTHLTLPTICSV